MIRNFLLQYPGFWTFYRNYKSLENLEEKKSTIDVSNLTYYSLKWKALNDRALLFAKTVIANNSQK